MTTHTVPLWRLGAETIEEIVRRQKPGYSLQQALYNSPEAFERDFEAIFRRYWLLAGHASMAPQSGDYFLCELADESVIIVRGRDGALRAFANVCRHRGSRICLHGQGRASVLVCPYHAWAYNLDGSLRSARRMTPDFDKSAFGLKSVALEVIEGLVLISFSEAPLSLELARKVIREAYAPYGWAHAKVAHRETYPISANWKLAVENYLECYHCTPAHPEYSKLHALEQPLDQIGELNAAMEARTSALGLTVPGADHRAGSSTGEASVFTFRYALYDGVKTGGPEGKPVAPLMGDFRDYDGGVTSNAFRAIEFLHRLPRSRGPLSNLSQSTRLRRRWS